ncbi:hypothetical protein V8C86DRAFT_921780 [Haematococcus lacustris]
MRTSTPFVGINCTTCAALSMPVCLLSMVGYLASLPASYNDECYVYAEVTLVVLHSCGDVDGMTICIAQSDRLCCVAST